MFVFVSDRFASVFLPFSYSKHQKKFVVFLSVLAWSISIIFAILPLALDCETFSRVAFYCTGGNGCSNVYACQSSRLLTITLTNIMGSFIPLVLYLLLFIKAKKMKNSVVAPPVNNQNNAARHNITFFFLFLALFGVNLIPFLFFIIGNSIISTLMIHSPSQYVVTTTVVRSLYNILPLIDAIAIMRNSDYRCAMRSFKSNFFSNYSFWSPQSSAPVSSNPSTELNVTSQRKQDT